VCVTDCLTDIRQCLAVPRLIAAQSDGGSSGAGTVGGPGGATGTGSGLGELLRDMHTSLVSQLKSVLIHLQVSDSLGSCIFSSDIPGTFRK